MTFMLTNNIFKINFSIKNIRLIEAFSAVHFISKTNFFNSVDLS